MDTILIGSRALDHHTGWGTTPNADWDYFTLTPTATPHGEQHGKVEHFYDPALKEYAWSGNIATVDELYTIKLSHIYWDLPNKSWWKHAKVLARMRRELNPTIIEPLHDLLYSVWEKKHGKKLANLEQEPDEFFNPNVDRIYDHDSIHASVAYYNNVPLFNRILRDDHPVAVSRKKFNNLTPLDKELLVREELHATALERRIIPANYRTNPTAPYREALQKLITSYSKGWFATFVADNLHLFLKMDATFVERHLNNKHLLIPHPR